MPRAPSTENYTLGKGVLYVDLLDGDGGRTGEIDVGNVTNFAITPTVESLDHFTSRSGIREKDLTVDTSLAFMAKWTTDEYALWNLMLAVLTTTTETFAQGTGHQINEPVTMRTDKWMKLGGEDGGRNIHDIVVTNTAHTVTYVEGTDYNVDRAVGRLFGVDGGNIANGQEVHVDYHYDATQHSYVRGGEDQSINAFLRFVGDPAQGPVMEGQFWKVRVKPSGDIGFISEEFSTLEFEGEIQYDASGHPTEPWFRIIDLTENESAVS